MVGALTREKACEMLMRYGAMGFSKTEQREVLEASCGSSVSRELFAELRLEADALLPDVAELETIKADLRQTWARNRAFQSDLLAMYHNQMRNYNARQAGLVEHDDGAPVMSVKLADLIGLMGAVTKLDESFVTSRLAATSRLNALTPPPVDVESYQLSDALGLEDDD